MSHSGMNDSDSMETDEPEGYDPENPGIPGFSPARRGVPDEAYDPENPGIPGFSPAYDPEYVDNHQGYDPRHPGIPGYSPPYEPGRTTADEPYDPRNPGISGWAPARTTTTASEGMEIERQVPDEVIPEENQMMPEENAPVDPAEWWASAWQQGGLNLGNDRLQDITGSSWLWHNSQPYYLLQLGTLQFCQWADTQPLGTYYRNADRFTGDSPQSTEFWLAKNADGDYTNDVHTSAPDAECIWVPWEHLTQHLYQCCDLTTKEVHTFWPWGTTEDEVLGHLVDALNNYGTTGVDGTTADVAFDGDDNVKTFFLRRPQGHQDVYSAGEIEDIANGLGG
jgi:hypothetical protein